MKGVNMDYQIEIKQIVDYPRCRIYRNFLRDLIILDFLQERHYITYSKLARGNLIKFTISDWKNNNTWLEYNYPCTKDMGFFFFPVSTVHELISMGRCSEMDIVLDLWIHAIYNDAQIQGSDIGPVVYFRNSTKNPLISYTELSARWGISKATVSRVLNKLQEMEYLSLVSFTGRHGSVIYLCSYLSTMFAISDVMIDKEEVSMTFKVPIHLPDETPALDNTAIREEQIIIDEYFSFVFPAPCPQRCVAGVADNDFAKGVKGILDMFPVIFCAGHGNSPFPPKRVVHD